MLSTFYQFYIHRQKALSNQTVSIAKTECPDFFIYSSHKEAAFLHCQ